MADRYEIEHPGKLLARILAKQQLSQMAFCEIIKMSRSYVNQIITGAKDINISMAFRLGQATGIPAMSWMKLQTEYDAYKFEKTPEFEQIQKIPRIIMD